MFIIGVLKMSINKLAKFLLTAGTENRINAFKQAKQIIKGAGIYYDLYVNHSFTGIKLVYPSGAVMVIKSL